MAHVILRVRRYLSVSPLLHHYRSHVSQDNVLYLDLCCSQHAETCHLHRVHFCVLVKVLRLSGFRSRFSKWLNCRAKADGFWANSPPLLFSFCCYLSQFLLITPCIHILSLNWILLPPPHYHILSAQDLWENWAFSIWTQPLNSSLNLSHSLQLLGLCTCGSFCLECRHLRLPLPSLLLLRSQFRCHFLWDPTTLECPSVHTSISTLTVL